MQKLIHLKNWLKARPVWQFVFAAAIGFLFAFFASPEFLSAGFGVVSLSILVFATLSVNSAKEDQQFSDDIKAVSFLLPSAIARPTAKVRDLMALRCFLLSLIVLAEMAVGTFAAVPFQ